MIRCKFVLQSITEYSNMYNYVLAPVYGSEENKVYWDATPSGSLNVSIVRDKGKLFEVGKSYYVDISEAR